MEQTSEESKEDGCKTEEGGLNVKSGLSEDAGSGLEVVDPELDALLDSSLGDFGKHIPPPSSEEDPTPKSKASNDIFTSSLGTMFANMRGLEEEEEGDGEGGGDPMMKELEDVFGEEFAKQAEAQLTDAMEMLKTENPELLKQFEELAKSVGLEDEEEAHQDSSKRKTTDPFLPDARTGEKKDQVDHTFQSVVEDTLQRIQESSQTPEESERLEGLSSKLMEMMGNIDIEEGGEGEEQVMKMMEGMMKTLLSKDVLYPSLVDFCRQYPEWLDRQGDSLSAEDRARYVHQLEIMRQICKEFEKEETGGREERERQERILKLMQELQKYGQPPEDLGGPPLSQIGLPPSAFSSSQTEDKCTLM